MLNFIKKQNYSSLFILIDKTVHKLYCAQLKSDLPGAQFIVIPAGEKHKNLDTLSFIIRALFERGADRKSALINFGGGVVCDMGGLAAALYMRGIAFIQMPTTLLAQVDASIGGKTAVDLDGAKNIIGAFVQPAAVFIDIRTLGTLPLRQLRSGWAEVLKHGLIFDKKYFNEACALDIKNISPDMWLKIVRRSCQIKAHYVNIDERELGPRKTLNFGHTIGHAVETLSFKTKTPLLHGEAVALGMLAAARLSVLESGLKEAEFNKIKAALSSAGFALKFPHVKKSAVEKLILKDKKNVAKKIKWTLLSAIGSSVFDVECSAENIAKAIDEIL